MPGVHRTKGWSADRQILAAATIALAVTAAVTAFLYFAGMQAPAAPLLGFALGVVMLLAWVRPGARSLEESEHRLRTVTDNAAALIGYIDAERRYRVNNATYEDWLDADRSRITGRKVSEVLGDAVYDAIRPHLENALNGRRTTFETRITVGGRARDVQLSYVPDVDAEGRVRGLFEVATDVTRLKDVERELSRLAHYDSLTGALNRVAFNDHLFQALARARRAGTATAVMTLDIDRFRDLRRKLGHPALDELLREFAIRLKASLRSTDTVARFGADEFAVILEGIGGRDEIGRVGRKILQAMRAPLRLDGAELPLTTSIGVALGPHDAVPDQMMKDADTALSWAKAGGGNTFRVFAPAYGAAAVRSVGSDLDRRSA